MSNFTDTLQRGDKIGCYRIEEVLGRGGFAVTYLATDENLDVEVAIKEYLPREITQRDENLQVSARKPEFVEDYDVGLENFAREAKTLARFKHPHIVRVHQVLHANNTAYMVMDYEQGQELAEILEQHQTLPEDELRAILFPILDGVEEIHRHGFVHRDIKPSNIYIRHNGSPVLIDFGAARYAMSETTQQLTAVVTVGYTPIEQYNVSEDAQGPWSDIYALAAVCYEAVTGNVPSDSVTRASASVTKGNDPLPSVRSNAKREYTDDCLDAIDWGLRMEAEDRPQVIAQWRDSFDGIFNPASAYVSQKDVSIYSPHRVDSPLRSRDLKSVPDTPEYDNDVVSIPLRNTETPMDAGVVSLDRDSVVTTMPPIPPQASNRNNTQRPDANVESHGRNTNMPPIPGSSRVSEHPAAHSANDAQPTNLHGTAGNDHRTETPAEPRKRSKLERPSHLDGEAKKNSDRTLHSIREEIEFDETDWDYEPPKKNSPWKLIFPALALTAVFGASLLYVNFPELITNLGKRGPNLTTEQALELAEQRMAAGQLLSPDDGSALFYYQHILEDDPDNAEAQAGVRRIETAVLDEIADNMSENNLSEANRLLARADKAGLTGIYTSSANAAQAANPQANTNTAETSAVVTPSQDTVITAVDTAPLEPTRPSQTPSQSSNQQPVQPTAPVQRPNTGIDNNVSPYIESKIAEINTLVDQKRFDEARVLYNETDKFIPNQTVSRRLLQKIETGEAEAVVQTSSTEATNESLSTAPQTTNNTPSVAQSDATIASNQNTQNATIASTTTATNEPPRTGFVDGSGPGADHLNQLRLALEAQDLDAVRALSQDLPDSRIRFLQNTFARTHRIDVTINDVRTSGNTVTGQINVSMFGRSDDGSIYGAGKWNGAAASATRVDGVWQKIRW